MNSFRHFWLLALATALTFAGQWSRAAMVGVTSTHDGAGHYQYRITHGTDPYRFGGTGGPMPITIPSCYIINATASPGWQVTTSGTSVALLSPTSFILDSTVVTSTITSTSLTPVLYDALPFTNLYPRGLVVGTVYTTNGMIYLPAASNEVTSLNVVGFERFALTGPGHLAPTDPFVDITNANASVATIVTSYTLGGTNNSYTIGRIAWTNSLGGGGSCAAASTGWTFSVALAVGSNIVSATGTNSLGTSSMDSVIIFRPPLPGPHVAITNLTGTTTVDVSFASYVLKGTNSSYTVGTIVWTNALGGNGAFPAAGTGWTFTVNLGIGDNAITVRGTNAYGISAASTVTIQRPEPMPYVCITNGTDIVVCCDASAYTLGGTNNAYVVGGMWWTNESSHACGALDAAASWTIPSIPLSIGPNAISVFGTNAFGRQTNSAIRIWRYTIDGSGQQSGSIFGQRRAGSLVAWGRNDNNQTNCPPGYGYVAIAAGGYHTMALKDDGTLLAWGRNDYYQTNCPPGNTYVAVAAGWYHSLALRNNGTLIGWGNINYGLTNCPAGSNYVAIAAGFSHSLALRSDGTLAGWGDNTYGQTSCPPGNTYVAIAAGWYHNVALRRDGTLVAWGRNTNGQTNCPAGSIYAAVGAGEAHSVALRNDGTVEAWGYNDKNQTNSPGGTAHVAIAAGRSHSVALRDDGTLVGWGTNWYGATDCPAGSTFAMVAAGGYHNVAIRNAPVPSPADVQQFQVARGAQYGQVSLSWSNATITVLACTNRSYTSNMSYWFVLTNGVSSPWTHTAATNFASVYYRIISGSYTSAFDVGKFDVDIAAGSIAWLSFPFATQPGCSTLGEWFGRQLQARNYSSYSYPMLQVQNGLGGTVVTRSYYIDGTTNWFASDDAIVQNAGYVLFLAQDHPAVKLTSLGMVPTNDVTLKVPYQTIPWVGLSYPSSVDMRDSGITNLFSPPKNYSTFDYDFVDSQETLGGAIWYAEYFIDDWGGGTTNFFVSVAGADAITAGKGYLLFFSTARTQTGTWTWVKPY